VNTDSKPQKVIYEYIELLTELLFMQRKMKSDNYKEKKKIKEDFLLKFDSGQYNLIDNVLADII